ncbi:MAG: DNA alkylation repair protein [Bacteroidia bacterium]
MATEKRKGAKSVKEIPPEILKQLNNGTLETANLVEWLAIDQRQLLQHFLHQTGYAHAYDTILKQIAALKKQTFNTVNEAIAKGLLDLANQHKDQKLLTQASKHTADLVRCWAAYMIGRNEKKALDERFKAMTTLAADSHFGVREVAWLAIRPDLAKHIDESIVLLTSWAKDKNENIRRFATEATRPRGVWCEHIEVLKQNPEKALPILEPLKSDSAKYVQDSVGNWLNDASKTQAKFVTDLCKRWTKASPTKETAYIIKKALRTIEK